MSSGGRVGRGREMGDVGSYGRGLWGAVGGSGPVGSAQGDSFHRRGGSRGALGPFDGPPSPPGTSSLEEDAEHRIPPPISLCQRRQEVMGAIPAPHPCAPRGRVAPGHIQSSFCPTQSKGASQNAPPPPPPPTTPPPGWVQLPLCAACVAAVGRRPTGGGRDGEDAAVPRRCCDSARSICHQQGLRAHEGCRHEWDHEWGLPRSRQCLRRCSSALLRPRDPPPTFPTSPTLPAAPSLMTAPGWERWVLCCVVLCSGCCWPLGLLLHLAGVPAET